MKNLILSLCVVTSLALTGCASTTGSTDNTVEQPKESMIAKYKSKEYWSNVGKEAKGYLNKTKDFFGFEDAHVKMSSKDQKTFELLKQKGGLLLNDINGDVFVVLSNEVFFNKDGSISSNPFVNELLNAVATMATNGAYSMSFIGHSSKGWGTLSEAKAEEKNIHTSTLRANALNMQMVVIYDYKGLPTLSSTIDGLGSADYFQTFEGLKGNTSKNLGGNQTVTIHLQGLHKD